MKILLQQVRSKRYFCGGDVWTANLETAFDFQHPQWLREFVAKHHLREVQMEQFEVVSLQSPLVREWPRMQA